MRSSQLVMQSDHDQNRMPSINQKPLIKTFQKHKERPATVTGEYKGGNHVVFSDMVNYRFSNEGLWAIKGSALELADSSCVSELPASIVFNLMLEGQADFALGKQRYSLEAGPKNEAQCSAIILGDPETLVRYTKKGVASEKLSLIAERSWLESRAKNREEKQRLDSIFSQHCAFRYWQPSDKIIQLAIELFSTEPSDCTYQYLIKEAQAIRLLSICLDEMEQLSQLKMPVDQHVSSQYHLDGELKSHIDQMLDQCATLENIAESLSCSVSTLQRRFKASYGIPVIHYCRHRRLDMAKRELTLNGVTIGEAAYIAGYKHPSNFISAFKKRFNVTPTELIRVCETAP